MFSSDTSPSALSGPAITPVRAIRRRVTQVSLRVTWRDGSQREYGRAELLTPVEHALRAMAWAVSALAVALVLAR